MPYLKKTVSILRVLAGMLCLTAAVTSLCLAKAIASVSMRTVTLIVVHCSATPEGRDFHASDIDRWHRARGWKMIGYHYVVNLNGTIEQGRPEPMVGAHCQGHNEHSIGVCYIGGLDARGRPADTRTPAQKKALRHLLEKLHAAHPKAFIVGHHDLNPAKACPCMDVVKEYADLQTEWNVATLPEGRAALWHCSQGKDRAGCASDYGTEM